MEKSGFHLSVFGGELKAVATRRGAVTGTWECPNSVADFVGLPSVLREAVQATHAEGNNVSLVLAHQLLSDQVIDVPPVKRRTLERLLDRQVKALKAFPGDPVWSSQPALSTKKGASVLLHVCPRFVVDQLSRSCRGVGLHLTRVIPTTSLLMGQLKQLPLQKGEVALLAAETGPSTTIVVGGGDGRVCLGRVLRESWNSDPDRIAVDLTRSIGFAEQQSGVTVNGVWLFGAGAQAQMAPLQAALNLPVQLSPVPHTRFYWAEQLGKLPEKGDGNLVSAEARAAPKRRRLLTVTSVLLCMLLTVALGAASVLEILRRNALGEIDSLNVQIADQRAQQAELEAAFAEFEQMQKVIRVVNDERPAPVPGWFLGYLSEVVPEDLVLTHLRVARTNDFWSVHMEGAVKPTTTALPPAELLEEKVSALTNSLVTGPFRLTLAPPAAESTQAATPRQGLFRLPFNPLATPAPVRPAGDRTRFVIEGVMR